MNGPSEHLAWDELKCRDGAIYPLEWRADRAVELAVAFERIRALCGFPIMVNSGYRTAVYNDRINGAPKSQHVEGRALDLCPIPSTKANLLKLKMAAFKARDEGLIRGLAVYPRFVHVDTRAGKNVTWRGSRDLDGTI